MRLRYEIAAFAALLSTLGWGLLGCDEHSSKGAAGGAPTGNASASASVSEGVTQHPPPPTWQGGSIVHAATEEVLWVADEDRGLVSRLQLPLSSETTADDSPMPGTPAQVLALADRLLVTIRDPGLLLVMAYEEDGLVEKSRVALPADAWGLAITHDQKTALVTSAWTHKVSAVDLDKATLKWTVDVAREPRAVVVVGDHAFVTHLVGRELTRIDGIASAEPTVKRVDLPPAPSRAPRRDRSQASLAYAATTTPDGSRLFVARHALGALGDHRGRPTWLGASTVDVLLTQNDEPLSPTRMGAKYIVTASDTMKKFQEETGMPLYSPIQSIDGPEGPLPGVDAVAFVQPRAVVYRSKTKSLLVVSEGEDRLVELDALSLEPALHPIRIHGVGRDYDKFVKAAARNGAPSGVALSADEAIAYVFCRSTFDVVAVPLDGKTKPEDLVSVRLAEDPLIAEVAKDDPKRQFREAAVLGRKLFYNAVDDKVSGGMGCAGCHPDGRDDGHVWHEVAMDGSTNFVGGHGNVTQNAEPVGMMQMGSIAGDGKARQTPMLAGRVAAEGPYGWMGESKTLVDRIADGFGLHRWGSSGDAYGRPPLVHRASAIAAFLKGMPQPPKLGRERSADENRGKELFLSKDTGCTSCHAADTDEYTDRVPMVVKLAPRAGFVDESGAKFKTPSLRFVAGTPPYFHNGSAQTLAQLIAENDNRMGKTNQLSAADKQALVAFLRTL
jgi:cytochrome c peroxidase